MRYLVFKYELYESNGGAKDFFFSAETPNEVKDYLNEYFKKDDSHNIVLNVLDIKDNSIYGNYYIDTMYIDSGKMEIINNVVKNIFDSLKSNFI